MSKPLSSPLAPHNDPLLELQSLTSVRGERTLFEAVDLCVRAGEIHQVEGPNGAGKSTLLRIIAGLLAPQTGSVLYRGQPQHDVRRAFLQDLLFIGHKAAVKAELTALENLTFFAATQGHPCSEPPFALLAQLGLVGLEDVPAATLSAGQQRRIALARLWLSSASLWVLDEPFTSLDVAGIELLHQHFNQHLQQGGAIILTSHQPLDWPGHALHRLQLEYSW